MKTHIVLTLSLALFASTILPSCSGGGRGGLNANVGGIAKVSAGGSGHSHRRR